MVIIVAILKVYRDMILLPRLDLYLSGDSGVVHSIIMTGSLGHDNNDLLHFQIESLQLDPKSNKSEENICKHSELWSTEDGATQRQPWALSDAVQ